ncbi:hypothetical protein [uncultured Flavobacterium sp.]|uniref:hypothetical protein n=1 Tax=uncultured Flavobacterium sp. TaxID=165435 RepID=UPI0030EF9819
MKTITFLNQKNKRFFRALIVLLVTGSFYGQVQQNSSIFIGDAGVLAIHTTPYNFGASPVYTTTTRTAVNYGKLYFSAGTNLASATDANHVNGYVSSFANVDFTFPIGNGTVLAPARVQSANLTATYDGAYYSANPLIIDADLNLSTLKAISTSEYWDIQSTSSAALSLTWRAGSNIATMAASITLADVVIAGWNGTQWEQIPSAVDNLYLGSGATSNLTVGSITSTIPVDFSTYSKFTIGAKGSCGPLVASNGLVRIWNGSIWIDTLGSLVSVSAPTLENSVIIQAAYNAGSFSCNSLQLDADLTLGAYQYVEIINGVTGSSKIIMDSSASVVQRASGVGVPTIEMTKTRTGLHRYDYVYFGTPVAGNFLSDMATASASTVATTNAFYSYLNYVTGAGGGWVTATATEAGKGFIARVAQIAPFTDASTTDAVSVVIGGVANNGDVTLTATNDPAQNNGGRSHVLLANPYPSAIDGDKFIEENTALDGVLYIWQSATSYSGSGQYNQADYLAYTKAGTVATAIIGTFDGKIPSGQGFRVKILPDGSNPTTVAATANISFTNCMRVTGNNSSFYKNSQQNTTATRDRFKINMTGDNGVFSQILVAYLPEATLGYDRMYDAGRNSVSTAQLYSILETNGSRLSINARPTFVNTDTVPVGVRKSNTNTESFVLSIAEQEGVFTDPTVKVYLHDKIANTYHDFSTGSFNYTTNEALVENRFEIVYQTTVLSNEEFTLPEATVLLNNNALKVASINTINYIQVYDVTGRMIEQYQAIEATTFEGKFNHEESVYIAKIFFDSGAVISKKLIHTSK